MSLWTLCGNEFLWGIGRWCFRKHQDGPQVWADCVVQTLILNFSLHYTNAMRTADTKQIVHAFRISRDAVSTHCFKGVIWNCRLTFDNYRISFAPCFALPTTFVFLSPWGFIWSPLIVQGQTVFIDVFYSILQRILLRRSFYDILTEVLRPFFLMFGLWCLDKRFCEEFIQLL